MSGDNVCRMNMTMPEGYVCTSAATSAGSKI